MPPTRTEVAVDKLMKSSQFLEQLFAAYYHDENNRRRLQDGTTSYLGDINTSLGKLTTANSIVAIPLKVPQGAFNNFIAVWNSGSGDLTRSNNSVAEFGRLLRAAKPAIDTIIKNLRGTGSPQGAGTPLTAQDIQRSQAIAEQLGGLVNVFTICATAHSDVLANKVKEFVTTINPLVYVLVRSQATPVQNAKTLWQDFTNAYKGGSGINLQTLEILRKFQETVRKMSQP